MVSEGYFFAQKNIIPDREVLPFSCMVTEGVLHLSQKNMKKISLRPCTFAIQMHGK